MEGFEKNRNTLRSALRQMQSYEAPASSWEQIGAELEQPEDQTEAPLQGAIQQLPTHAPPVDTWNSIANSLNQEKEAKRIKMRSRRQWIQRIAAVVVLALVAGILLNNRLGEIPTISKQYSEETMQRFHMEIDWDSGEETFEQLQQQLAQVNDPKLNKLQVEYEELTSAHQDVQGMLKAYGQDPQLIRKMADIERERTDIYRQILEQLI